KVEERKRVGGLLSRVRPVKFAALHGNGLQGQARDFRRAARSPALPDQTGRDRYLRNLARKDHEPVLGISAGVQGIEHRYRRGIYRHGREPDLPEKPESPSGGSAAPGWRGGGGRSALGFVPAADRI